LDSKRNQLEEILVSEGYLNKKKDPDDTCSWVYSFLVEFERQGLDAIEKLPLKK